MVTDTTIVFLSDIGRELWVMFEFEIMVDCYIMRTYH